MTEFPPNRVIVSSSWGMLKCCQGCCCCFRLLAEERLYKLVRPSRVMNMFAWNSVIAGLCLAALQSTCSQHRHVEWMLRCTTPRFAKVRRRKYKIACYMLCM